jgi:hypothetical protein
MASDAHLTYRLSSFGKKRDVLSILRDSYMQGRWGSQQDREEWCTGPAHRTRYAFYQQSFRST